MDLAAPIVVGAKIKFTHTHTHTHTHILFVLFLWRTILMQDLSHVKLGRGLGKVCDTS